MTLRPTRPQRGPTLVELADVERFETLVAGSLAATRKTAEKWRDALAALVAVATSAVLFKGRENVEGIDTAWKIVVGLLIGAGLAAILFGLVLAARAAFGEPQPINHTEIVRRFGDVRGYELHVARRAAQKLRLARRFVVLGLPLLIGGAFALWWAPAEASSATKVSVVIRDGGPPVTHCGKLISGDGTRLLIQQDGRSAPVLLAGRTIVSIRLVASCS